MKPNEWLLNAELKSGLQYLYQFPDRKRVDPVAATYFSFSHFIETW